MHIEDKYPQLVDRHIVAIKKVRNCVRSLETANNDFDRIQAELVTISENLENAEAELVTARADVLALIEKL